MSIRFPKRFTILQPPPPLAGAVVVTAGIGFKVVVGTTGASFSAGGSTAGGSVGTSLCLSTEE